jgi:hypothetical protein
MMVLFPIAVSAAIVGAFALLKASWLAALWLGLGLAGGIALLKADEWWLRTWYEVPGQPLITRSVLFMVAYIPLSLFVVTSSGSWLGSGLVVGIGLVLLTELYLLRKDEAALRAHFAPHLHVLSPRDISIALGAFSLLLLFLVIKLFI